jgi:catechol 2,3-dioxygenase-like lactoylglutathione lyase family enzyme
MIEIVGIDHLVLRTTQLERMRKFYVDVLGCAVEQQSSVEFGLTQLRAGNAMIDLVTVDSTLGRAGGAAPEPEGNNLDHFCLQVKAVSEQALTAYLQSHGIDVPEFSERYGAQGVCRTVYIKDPDGNTVELVSTQKG